MELTEGWPLRKASGIPPPWRSACLPSLTVLSHSIHGRHDAGLEKKGVWTISIKTCPQEENARPRHGSKADKMLPQERIFQTLLMVDFPIDTTLDHVTFSSVVV